MIELVLGGARSGKSAYALKTAEQLAEKLSGDLHFIATAEAHCGELCERIKRHQAERGPKWQLIEEPLELSSLTNQFSQKDVILVDCLTLWVSNWLCADNKEAWPTEKHRFVEAIQDSKVHWFLVSNEVGLGIIPMGQLTRDFVDQAGWLHQQLAQKADRVTMVTVGLPQTLK